MSIKEHRTKGKGWWQIWYRPNGRKGKQKVVTFHGTRHEAEEKEKVLMASKLHHVEALSRIDLPQISVDLSSSPYVYFIQQDKSGPIKIGFSANPVYRLRELQSGNPFELKIVGVIGNATASLETEMHNKFWHIRMCGEWFEPRDELIDFIKTYCNDLINGKLKMFSLLANELLVCDNGVSREQLVGMINGN